MKPSTERVKAPRYTTPEALVSAVMEDALNFLAGSDNRLREAASEQAKAWRAEAEAPTKERAQHEEAHRHLRAIGKAVRDAREWLAAKDQESLLWTSGNLQRLKTVLDAIEPLETGWEHNAMFGPKDGASIFEQPAEGMPSSWQGLVANLVRLIGKPNAKGELAARSRRRTGPTDREELKRWIALAAFDETKARSAINQMDNGATLADGLREISKAVELALKRSKKGTTSSSK